MSIELEWEITQMKNRIIDEGVFYTEWVCYAFKDGYQKSYNGYSEFTPPLMFISLVFLGFSIAFLALLH